jgi:WD40 repeat protein/transcriptional regulator with XRE-family HTH domain
VQDPTPGGRVISEGDETDPTFIQTRADLGRGLTAVRTRAGLTIRELAHRIDVPSATVGGYLSGRHVPSAAQLPIYTAILAVCGITERDQVAEWVTALGRARAVSDGRAARRSPPYRGLAPFAVADAPLYFGRSEATAALLERLAELRDRPADAARMLVVIGPSGSGKSSLLRAGLLAAIDAGRFDRPELGEHWTGTLFTPSGGHRPSAGQTAPADLLGELRASLDGVGPGPRVAVLDQFEELFTTRTAAERRSVLSELLLPRSAQTLLVLGMRADFYAAAAREPELVPVLQQWQFLVAPMTRDELREVIVEPARRLGAAVDDGLVELLITELAPRGTAQVYDAGVLPLLSHALLATWQRARRNQLTIADYRAGGGIQDAVQQTAESLWSELSEAEQALTRRIFLRLVTVDDDLVATRRRAGHAELTELGGDAAELVDRFVGQRLLTVDGDGLQISHEALLGAWPRLARWVDDDREGLRVHRQLTSAADAWQAAGRDDATLLRGARLTAALDWTADPDHARSTTASEQALIQASTAAEERARRATRRLHRLLAAVVVLAVVAVGLAGYSVHARRVADDQRGLATAARDEALSREVAIESARARSTDPALAAQLAVAAYRISPTTDARSAVLDTTSHAPVSRVLGPSGTTVVAVDARHGVLAVSRADDGSVRLYRLGTGPFRLIATLPADPGRAQLFALAFSPDGGTLATGGAGKVLRLWNVADPARPVGYPALPGGFRGGVQALAFSPDGRTMLAGAVGPVLRWWDVRDPAVPRTLAPPALEASASAAASSLVVQSLAFSRDGGRLAAGGSDSVIRVWRTDRLTAAPTVMRARGAVTTMAFLPGGTRLAAGDKGGVVSLWTVAGASSGSQFHPPLTGFTTWVNTLAVSADGRRLAAGSSDNSLRTWSTSDFSAGAVYPHPGPVTGVAFLPGSGDVVSADADGALRRWSSAAGITGMAGSVFALSYSADGERLDVATSGPQGHAALWKAAAMTPVVPLGPAITPPASFGPVDGSSALSPDGRTLAVGNRAGQVMLVDVADPTHPQPLPPMSGPTSLLESLTFSAGGDLLAAAADDNEVHLWEVRDPHHPVALPTLTGPKQLLFTVAVSRDGQLVAASSADNDIYLWDVSDRAHPQALPALHGFTNYAIGLAFSPDGRTVAAGGADHTVRLWDIGDPTQSRAVGPPLTGPADYAYTVAFSPDGSLLAAGSTDNTVWLWDVHERRAPLLQATLRAAAGNVFAVAFSPDGRTLAGGGGDAAVHLWRTDAEAAITQICGTTGDPLTAAEWQQYAPGVRYTPPCR